MKGLGLLDGAWSCAMTKNEATLLYPRGEEGGLCNNDQQAHDLVPAHAMERLRGCRQRAAVLYKWRMESILNHSTRARSTVGVVNA